MSRNGNAGAALRGRGVLVGAFLGLVSLIAVAAVARAPARDRTAPDDAARRDVPRGMSLGKAFPAARTALASDVGNHDGQVAPAGLLPDGTVYGVAKHAAGQGYVATAVTVDLRTGRRTIIDHGDGVAEPRFIAANQRWLIGVTQTPSRVRVGHGCDLAGTPCSATPGSPPRYWCHERSTGRTVDITSTLQRMGALPVGPDVSVTDTSVVLVGHSPDAPTQLAMDGCGAAPKPLGFSLLPEGHSLGPGLVVSVQDRFAQGYRVVAQDTRSGLTRAVLDGSGPVTVANTYGLAWPDDSGPAEPHVHFAPWGGFARTLDITAVTGMGHLTPVAAGERVFLLADTTRPLGELTLYDPVRDTLVRLGRAHTRQPWTMVWAAGPYVLWNDGSPDGYRWLDTGPRAAPPSRTLADLHIRG